MWSLLNCWLANTRRWYRCLASCLSMIFEWHLAVRYGLLFVKYTKLMLLSCIVLLIDTAMTCCSTRWTAVCETHKIDATVLHRVSEWYETHKNDATVLYRVSEWHTRGMLQYELLFVQHTKSMLLWCIVLVNDTGLICDLSWTAVCQIHEVDVASLCVLFPNGTDVVRRSTLWMLFCKDTKLMLLSLFHAPEWYRCGTSQYFMNAVW